MAHAHLQTKNAEAKLCVCGQNMRGPNVTEQNDHKQRSPAELPARIGHCALERA